MSIYYRELIEAMLVTDQHTWDLSDNDVAAIRWLYERAESAERALALLEGSTAERYILYRTGQGSLSVCLGGSRWAISGSLRDAIERAAACPAAKEGAS